MLLIMRATGVKRSIMVTAVSEWKSCLSSNCRSICQRREQMLSSPSRYDQEADHGCFSQVIIFLPFHSDSDNIWIWVWMQQNVILNLLFPSSRIIELCHQFPHGITDQVIQNDMPHMEAQQRAMAINRLLSMVG